MPDGVDTLMHPVQRSVRESMLYGVLAEAEYPQLPERDNSVLAISQPGNAPPTWAI